jgi:hypothetical protein
MRIGIIVDNELNNDKRVLREAKILADGGHEVFALCFRFDGTIEKEFDGITISRIYITTRGYGRHGYAGSFWNITLM